MKNVQGILYKSKSDVELLSMVDYTLLTPSATKEDIIKLCKKANELSVKSVCVLPKMVKIAKETLIDSKVLVCTVISFPHGTDTAEQKLSETQKAIDDGADECDMVLNYHKLNDLEKEMNFGSRDPEEIVFPMLDEVEAVLNVCHSHKNKDGDNVTLKIIVESGLLSVQQTKYATNICLQTNVDFIKTSTGMVSVGAEIDKVMVMVKIIDEHENSLKIKVSGGIRTLEDMKSFEPFADRYGMGFGSVDNIFLGEDSKSNY